KAAAPYGFTGIAKRPVLSLNRGFSAPVRVVANVGEEDLRFLAVHDSDPFNRWQAVYTLATRLLVDSTAAVRRGAAPLEDSDLMAAPAAVLATRDLPPASVPQRIALPPEPYIPRETATD